MQKKTCSKDQDTNYGPEFQKPDLDDEVFEREKDKFLEHLETNKHNRLNIWH